MNVPRRPSKSTPVDLHQLLNSVLPGTLVPERRPDGPIPPIRSNRPTATVIAGTATGTSVRPVCACGRGAAFKDTRNGKPRYRTECRLCRNRRREMNPHFAKPIALPHAVRPRCRVPGCQNAISVKRKKIVDNWDAPTWVPADAAGIFMGSPWCDRHSRLNDRPVGVLPPPPAYPTTDRTARFKTGRGQWVAWRKRMRLGLGLPAYGVVSWAIAKGKTPVIAVSTLGQGMRVYAWPHVIYHIAWWTTRMPLRDIVMSADLRDWWPTYASFSTAYGVSPALVAWVVWELRTGRIRVVGCDVERIACVGVRGEPYTQPLLYSLDPNTWQWTETSPADRAASNACRWTARKVENPPSYLGTRIPWRYRSPQARRNGLHPPPELLPPERRRSTSASPRIGTAPLSGTPSASGWSKLTGTKPTRWTSFQKRS